MYNLVNEHNSAYSVSIPCVLTAKKSLINNKGFNIINLQEYYPFQKIQVLPSFLIFLLIRIYNSLNKINVFVATRLFFNRKSFDVIVSGNVQQAMVYSLLGMIFPWNKRIHILNEIYLNEPSSFKRRIRPFVYRLFLKNVDYIRVSARNEIINYAGVLKMDRSRFWFNPWPSFVPQPEVRSSQGDYILSAGKQFRDYSTLVKAIRGTGCQLIIVSDLKSMKSLETDKDVKVVYNISKQEYFELLVKSKFVVVPLNNDFGSCGQISILEAMSYGKPVITARVTGSMDYLEDKISGLFYEKGNHQELREKIIALNSNPELRDSIAINSVSRIRKFFTPEIFAENYRDFISDKLGEHSTP